MSNRIAHYLSYEQLGFAINDILSSIKPSQEDRENREAAIMEFEEFIQGLRGFSGAEVEPFGSFLYNIYSRKADLDISVDVRSSLTDGELLAYTWRALLKRHINVLKFAPEARIPVLTFESESWKISCDVTFNNFMGQMKSKFLLWISKIDKRFCDMVLLVKEWARAHDINDPKEGTFNSYALCLLVIFHLQTCVPAILPPLKDIKAGIIIHSSMRSTEISHMENVCAANIEKFLYSKTINRSTLPQLMVSFLEKFSQLKDMAAEHVISTYSGKWERRNNFNARWRALKSNILLIIDPLQVSDNAARTVGEEHLTRISQVFENTYNSLIHAAPNPFSYKACLVGQEVS